MYIKIYFTDVSPLSDETLLSRLMSSLPADRREKAKRLRLDVAKRLSVGAGTLLKIAMEEAGLSPDTPVKYGEFGKPYVDGLYFNLSHSGDVAMCAVSDSDVGCDIEKAGEANFKIAEKYFSLAEREYLRLLGGDEKNGAFFKFWTCRESLLKALGTGFARGADCDADGIETAAVELCDGYFAAVSSRHLSECTPEIIRIDLLRRDFNEKEKHN